MAKKRSKKVSKSSSAGKRERRWFVNATGWGFELAVGSGSTQATGSKARRSLVMAPDTKLASQIQFINSATHGTQYWFNALGSITQGVTGLTRLGDRIFLENLSLRLLVSNGPSITPQNCFSYRVMLVASTAQFVTTPFTSGSFTQANVFNAPLPTGNYSCGVPDPRLCRVLCDEMFTLNPSTTAGFVQHYLHMDCVVNSWFEFQASLQVGVAANLFWVFLPEVYGGTVGATVVLSCSGTSAVTFRDE